MTGWADRRCRFILNGLEHANEIYGEEIFHIPDWRVIGEYVYDEEGGRHQAFLSPVRETTVLGSVVKPHERIQIEQSLKYTRVGSDRLWKLAGLEATHRWTLGDAYGKQAPFLQTPASLGMLLRCYICAAFVKVGGEESRIGRSRAAPHTASCMHGGSQVNGECLKLLVCMG